MHTLGFAEICWAIWKSRNKTCFDKKIIKNPAEILIHACALIEFWANLYNPELQGALIDGVKIILSCAHRVLAHQARHAVIHRLQDSSDNYGSGEQHTSFVHLSSMEEEASDQEDAEQ